MELLGTHRFVETAPEVWRRMSIEARYAAAAHLSADGMSELPRDTRALDFARYPWPRVRANLLRGVLRALNQKQGSMGIVKRLSATLLRAERDGTRRGHPVHFLELSTEESVNDLRMLIERARRHGITRYECESLEWAMDDYYFVRSHGIYDAEHLRRVLHLYDVTTRIGAEDDPLIRAERVVAEEQVVGFHPSSARIVSRVMKYADCGRAPFLPTASGGLSFLEPNGGKGTLCDAARALWPDAEITTVEICWELCEVLRLKGYSPKHGDFLEYRPHEDRAQVFVGFDRIAMNPPFWDAVAHIRHAFQLLAPRGRLVAVMPESSFEREDAPSTEFQSWLLAVGAYTERLPEGAFLTSDHITAVSSRLVVIDRREEGDGA